MVTDPGPSFLAFLREIVHLREGRAFIRLLGDSRHAEGGRCPPKGCHGKKRLALDGLQRAGGGAEVIDAVGFFPREALALAAKVTVARGLEVDGPA